MLKRISRVAGTMMSWVLGRFEKAIPDVDKLEIRGREMAEDLKRQRESCTLAMAHAIQMREQLDELDANETALTVQAEQALRDNREDIATELARQLHQNRQKIALITPRYESMKVIAENAITQYESSEKEFDVIRGKIELLQIQSQCNDIQRRVIDQQSSLNPDSAIGEIKKLEAKINITGKQNVLLGSMGMKNIRSVEIYREEQAVGNILEDLKRKALPQPDATE